jgi:hypothetical protein
MAKTLEELRADLGRAAGLFLGGAATSAGTTVQIIDANGLARITETDFLKGGLAYVRTDAGGAHAAPETEARRITAFTPASDMITVEYAFSAAVAAGDVYEVYRAPLTLEQWDLAINQAIDEAWPEVWRREVYMPVATGVDNYLLPEDAWGVDDVLVQMTGSLAGWPAQRLPRDHWSVDGTPGLTLSCRLVEKPESGRAIRFVYRYRYPALAATESTDLDAGYILAAAKAHLYEMLAGEAGGQADASRYLQLLNFWREQAGLRKMSLASALLGGSGVVPQKGK